MQNTYFWDFNLQMTYLLEKGIYTVSQVSRDYHVTRSLLSAWIRLYQERGEAAFVPSRSPQLPPEVERPRNEQEQVAHLERLGGLQALELDLLRWEICLKNSCRISPHNELIEDMLKHPVEPSSKQRE